MPSREIIAAMCLVLLVSSATASEYCTKEQYARDQALITHAFSSGMLVKGPKSLRDSILVQEGEWYKMNYPQQIAFMQSFECSIGGGKKQFLYLDVRSLATGRLLATWTLGALKPAEERPDGTNPESSGVIMDENRIGLKGEGRAAFIKSAVEECSRRSASVNCSCYANAMADSLSFKELKKASALGDREVGTSVLRPKIEAAAKRCLIN
jgi:hypothetical protein